MQEIITIHGLTKHFRDIVAIDSIDLSIRKGEMFSIVGPDGAGKTTTIRMLCGVLKPTAGTATILNYDLIDDLDSIKRNIGYLSQDFSLYGDLSIDENIEFFAEIHQVSDYQHRRDELLEFTRLKEFRNRLADRLSGGMKQKLALACTLIHKPEIIFLDEPTTGVDPVSRRDFWKILADLLKTGITIVMTTPYLDEAERCSRVAMMNQGKMMVIDTPDKVKLRMEGSIMELFCDHVRKASKLLKQEMDLIGVQAFGDRLHVIVEDKERDFPMVTEKLQDHQFTIQNWREVSPSLENVFISLLESE